MVSIITPVYNGKRFMEFCIKNVIEQNCPDAEHIIVDGGSTDETVQVIKLYAEKYSHIRWVSEKDKGQSDAMNKGIAMAKGEILGFLNVDDFYEPNVFCRIAEIFKTLHEPSLLVGNCNGWDNDGNLKWINKPAKLRLTDLLTGDESRYPFPVNPSAYFYHRSLHDRVGLYSVDEHFAMDLDFLLRAVQSAAEVKYVDELWGNFRYIEGTKTFEDMKSGKGQLRFENLLNKYRRQLPLLQRWQVTLKATYFKSMNCLSPFNIMTALKKRVNR